MTGIPRSTPLANLDQVIRLREGIFLPTLKELAQHAANSHRARWSTTPGATYTYDNDGNMITQKTSAGTTTYTYDYENRLTSVDQYGTVIATYTYNALGQRIGIKDSGTQTWTVYDGSSADAEPYADFNSSGSVAMRDLDGSGRRPDSGTDELERNDGVVSDDNLGSVRDIVSITGVGAGSHRLRQLRQHLDRDQRHERRSVQVRGDGV